MAQLISIAAFRIQNPIEAPFRTFAAWRKSVKTRNALHSLTARQLADIGLDRSDIDGRF